jgi:hypothetical protein
MSGTAACRATGRPNTAGALPSRRLNILQEAMKEEAALRSAPAAIREAQKWTDCGYLRKPPELLSFLAVKRGGPIRPGTPPDNIPRHSTVEHAISESSQKEQCLRPTGNHLPWYDEISR